eukprot:TRINITY_DN3030_c0_g2_i1.p1 TRINITY_DN3030_c0_g2~~TRINITY_DN3030_c0_g2_i1.p1  ORF type:complete len:146 (-),score=17.94 TRINITY_DN3030_c0_g2_i1:196-633(-)
MMLGISMVATTLTTLPFSCNKTKEADSLPAMHATSQVATYLTQQPIATNMLLNTSMAAPALITTSLAQRSQQSLQAMEATYITRNPHHYLALTTDKKKQTHCWPLPWLPQLSQNQSHSTKPKPENPIKGTCSCPFFHVPLALTTT